MKELDFNLSFENFYCPITGEQVIMPEEFSPSPAMVFTFLHPYTYFEHLREDLQEQFAEEFQDESKHGDLYLKLTEEVLKDEQNYLWITHGGPPFGYISFCFDMGYKANEEDKASLP